MVGGLAYPIDIDLLIPELPFRFGSSMSDVVIRAEGLGKKYLIGHEVEHGKVTLRDTLARGGRNLRRKLADMARGRAIVAGDAVEEFWALKDVSFEVKRGEVLGIIGRNGAGKSTLLKILSRITEPTEGRVTINGRVASLLEVGTGFHGELTGRENVYLNGAILGMTHAEVRRKFDEIVAFADIEKFLDTPVKRYSSGMYVRLAFAVAAHLEPEILIVDEVLAVGDTEFQRKCLGKMDEVARRDGRTVLLVSHNLAAVAELSSRALLLQGGSITTDGPVSKVVSGYLSLNQNETTYISPHGEQKEAPHIARAKVNTSRSNGVQYSGEPLDIKVCIRHRRPLREGCLGVQIVNQFQVSAAAVYAYPPDCLFGQKPGTTTIQFHIPRLRLNVGHFHLSIWLTEPPGGEVHEIVDEACNFEVMGNDRGIVASWSPKVCTYREDFLTHVTERTDDQELQDRAGAALHLSTD
jgi:lipopolysaccharide transport system ATP-binding protein